MTAFLIADSLTRDFFDPRPPFTEVQVNLGVAEVERLMGGGSRYGEGVLPTFLRSAAAMVAPGGPLAIILVRDLHHPTDPEQQAELLRYGPHNLLGSPGAEWVDGIAAWLPMAQVVETSSLGLPIGTLQAVVRRLSGLDLLNLTPAARSGTRFLLVGAHTDKRILGTANLLRHGFGFEQVAVCPHLVGSSNRKAHLETLQGILPDALVHIIPGVPEAAVYLGLAAEPFHPFDLGGCTILPASMAATLPEEARDILAFAFIHCSEVRLRALSGGFSGSKLFVAEGVADGVVMAPKVIKIDTHLPIRRELLGYERVKSILGGVVPAFDAPISFGRQTGVVMELAARSGKPDTLQNLFERAHQEKPFKMFLECFGRALELLAEKLYRPTLARERFAPYQRFGLQAIRQVQWLSENLAAIAGEAFKQTGRLPLSGALTLADFTGRFREIARNLDAVPGETCLAHGDLNLANLITDDLRNLWVIDWTHTGRHPLALDLAKLENDLCYVLIKQFTEADLPQLAIWQQFLLHHTLLPPIAEAVDEVAPLGYDFRYQKLYRTVALLRRCYQGLSRQGPDWLQYRIALLRYAIHTLSFDARRGRGECTLPQLKYAAIGVGILVDWLWQSDFHQMTSGARPDSYPERTRIKREQAAWEVPGPDYHPAYHVDDTVLMNDGQQTPGGWADPESIDAELLANRPSLVGPLRRDDQGRLLNPLGRTGLAGRGVLGRWGPNQAVDPVVTRIHPETGQCQVVLGVRADTGELALPGGLVRAGETDGQALTRCFAAKTGGVLTATDGVKLYCGYADDFRNTDHAWIETSAWHFHCQDSTRSPCQVKTEWQSGTGLQETGWWNLTREIIPLLFAGHARLIGLAVQRLIAENQLDPETHEALLAAL